MIKLASHWPSWRGLQQTMDLLSLGEIINNEMTRHLWRGIPKRREQRKMTLIKKEEGFGVDMADFH